MHKSKRKVFIAILTSLFLLTAFISEPNVSYSKLKLTYIANEGFLIEAGNKSILIDALYGEDPYDFCDNPTPEALEEMKESIGAFANVDLIAATHMHRDHFHAPFVTSHLLSNVIGKFISCEQTVDILSGEEDYAEISNRVIEITPDSLLQRHHHQ